MSTRRARRGEVGLVRLRSGVYGLRWGRALAHEKSLKTIESTGRRTHTEAMRYLRRRYTEVFGETPAPAVATIVALDVLVSRFLRAYAGGRLPGKTPREATTELAVYLL